MSIPSSHSIRQFEEIYRLALEAGGTGILYRNFETGEDIWNPRLVAVLGLDDSRMLSQFEHSPPTVHPDDKDFVRDYVTRQRASGSPIDFSYRVIDQAGETRWVHELGRYEMSPAGRPARYYGVMQDITAQKRQQDELDRNRRRLELALNAHDMGVWELDGTTGEAVWSENVYRLLGYEPYSVPASTETWQKVIHPEDRAWVKPTLDETSRSSSVTDIEYRIIVEGQLRWLRDSWQWIFDDAGKPKLCYGLTRDVTDRKESERLLKSTEERLRLAMRAANLGIWEDADTPGTYVWNDQLYLQLGYEPHSVASTSASWYARIHPEDSGTLKEMMTAARAGTSVYKGEYRVILPGGEVRWIEERGEFSEILFGSSRARGVLIDVTERKQLETTLKESLDRLQLALDMADIGVWTHHAPEEVGRGETTWDARTFRILGYEPHAVEPSTEAWLARVHPEDRAAVAAKTNSAATRDGVTVVEYRIVGPEGDTRWVETQVRGDAGSGGRGIHFSGLIRDITERKAREAYLLSRQRIDAAGQLMGSMVHDFNNLLALISGTIESVEPLISNPAALEQLRTIKMATADGALFNRRLMNIANTRQRQPETLSVNERLAALKGPLEKMLGPKARLTMDFEPALWAIEADALDLQSAVVNLVLNARDAIRQDGHVAIVTRNQMRSVGSEQSSSTATSMVTITVSDNGYGMDADTRKRAAEPFFTTKPAGSGTGLGLASVATFVAGCGGRLEINSEPGVGTAVTLIIPRAPLAAAVRTRTGPHLSLGDGEFVLVVDDDNSMREMTMRRVEALGYSVEAAASAEDAIQKLMTLPEIAVVLSDVMMPDASKAQKLYIWLTIHRPQAALVFHTARVNLAPALGADAARVKILEKPCSRADLAAALADAVSLHRAKGGVTVQA